MSRVVVIGDVMLDRYIFGVVSRVSPEAPVPILNFSYGKDFLGGAANVSFVLSQIDCDSTLFGVVGTDEASTRLFKVLNEHKNIEPRIYLSEDRMTTTKIRFISMNQQLLRVDKETDEAVNSDIKNFVLESLRILNYDVVILSDYAKGMLSGDFCKDVISICKMKEIPVVVDPKGDDWEKYKGVDVITPNLKELELGVGKKDIREACNILLDEYDIRTILVTLGDRGLFLNGVYIPIEKLDFSMKSVIGCGDVITAIFSYCKFILKFSDEKSAEIANEMAARSTSEFYSYISKDVLLKLSGE